MHVEPPIPQLDRERPGRRHPVRRSSGEKIGTIERLMIDKLSGNVAYAVLSFGGFLGMGQKHLPIPGHGSPTTARLAPTNSTSPRRS